jgi:hypothetical protein
LVPVESLSDPHETAELLSMGPEMSEPSAPLESIEPPEQKHVVTLLESCDAPTAEEFISESAAIEIDFHDVPLPANVADLHDKPLSDFDPLANQTELPGELLSDLELPATQADLPVSTDDGMRVEDTLFVAMPAVDATPSWATPEVIADAAPAWASTASFAAAPLSTPNDLPAETSSKTVESPPTESTTF